MNAVQVFIKNLSIYKILSWVAWTMGQMNHRPRVMMFQEYKLKGFLKRIWQEIMKKTMLETSDAWSTIHLSHRPSDPAYYIVY